MDEQYGEETVDTPTSASAHTSVEILTSWPGLCQWLAEQGLLVFCNIINPEKQWHWSWMGKTASGYLTAQDAILAALQEQFPPAEKPSPFSSSADPFLPFSGLPNSMKLRQISQPKKRRSLFQ